MLSLSHKAVGFFFTHGGGWNSTVKALNLGVAMDRWLQCMPRWTDKPTNFKLVEDVWKVGFELMRRVGELEKKR